jgi:hypothetical protein
VSTVLEALRAQQQGAAGVPPYTPPVPNRSRRSPWLLVAAGISIAVLSALLVLFLRPHPQPPVSAPRPAAGPPVPAAPAPQVAAPPPAVPAGVPAEVPRGRVGENTLAPAKAPPLPKPKRAQTTSENQESAAASRARAQPEAPARPGGAGVDVKVIHYSGDSAKRTVTLWIGGEAVTLHEGQAAHGVEVQLILPDMVYVRNGGSVAAIAGPP